MTNYDITMVRGDTLGLDLTITEVDISTVESIYFSVKRKIKDDEYVFQESLDHGITDLGDGNYFIRIAPEDTQELASTTYDYDIELTIGSDVYTLVIGKFTLIADVTTR